MHSEKAQRLLNAWNRPESKHNIDKLRSLFKKVIILTRVALILKKLIASRQKWSICRRRTVIEDIETINNLNKQNASKESKNDKNQKTCFDTTIFKQQKDNSIQVDKNLRRLLRTPKSLRFTDTIEQINAVLNCRFKSTHNHNSTIWGRYPKKVRNQLCKNMEYHFVDAGKQILKYGHTCFNYYLIYSGIVRVNKPVINQADKFYTEAKLGKGNQFGELGLQKLIFNKRTADVIAETDCELIVIPRVSVFFIKK